MPTPEVSRPGEMPVCVGPGIVIQCRLAGEASGGADGATGSGTELPAGVRGEMEGAFGADFSAVRVHEDDRAQAMGALAYTQGHDIHFGPGQYDPSSHAGRDLLGHELTHVIQQSQGRVAATTQARGVGVNDDSALEREADEMGGRAARGERVDLGPVGTAAGAVQRKEGWSDGWVSPDNKKTQQVGTIRRVPLQGLTTVGEANKGRAIALIPDGLDPSKPVEVLLHLHGHDKGWALASDKTDHQLEQQLAASGHPQMIGLLPQGSESSDFSTAADRTADPKNKGFNASTFIDEALGELFNVGALAAKPTTPPAKVVVSAHSGGGDPLGQMLEAGTAGNPDEVLLFEAINGPVDELPRIKRWLTTELTRELTALSALPGEAQQLAFLDSSLRFRAYHGNQGLYAQLHETGTTPASYVPLKQFLDDWFGLLTLPPAVVTKFHDNFQVIDTGTGVADHPKLVGKGKLAAELQALVPSLAAPQSATPTPTPQPVAPPQNQGVYEPTEI